MKQKKTYKPYPGGLCKLKGRCKYGCLGYNAAIPNTCDYLLITGKRRPCLANHCTVFEPMDPEEKKKMRGRKWVTGDVDTY